WDSQNYLAKQNSDDSHNFSDEGKTLRLAAQEILRAHDDVFLAAKETGNNVNFYSKKLHAIVSVNWHSGKIATTFKLPIGTSADEYFSTKGSHYGKLK
ncbi:MAG: hypothetical protein KDK41_18065, partial [Leptospiraceae bacterium]|nr:hypothetical protein [Leptospiraceae bacterium]